MADLKLKNGREIDFDLDKITIVEFRALFDPSQPDEVGDEIVGRTCGLTLEEVQALGQASYRRLMKAFFDKARSPLAEEDGSPN